MLPKFITIGVYGFDQDTFFQALLDANVDTFCDIRLRRGMRGSTYAFVNSASLQQRLRELGIRYLHIKDLAPSREIRAKQKQDDATLKVAKRTRNELGQTFIQAYEEECLSQFDFQSFVAQLTPEAKVVGLFCVEREPEACHRSLVAARLTKDLGLQVEHVTP